MANYRLKLARVNSLKLRVSTRIPANLIGNEFITITRGANGEYSINADYTVLTPGPIADPSSSYIAVQDLASGVYKTVTLASLLVSGLDADLQAIAALSGAGILVRTADNAWSLRSVVGTANEITVTNGAGTAGNPTLSLPSALTFTGKTVTGGTFDAPKINAPTGIVKADVGLSNVDNTTDANKPVSTATQAALDTKVNLTRTITAGTGLTGGGALTSDVALALSSGSNASLAKADAALPKAGGTMTGALTLAADPASALQAATKQYVDAVAQGLDAKPSVIAATTANITLSGPQTIDGVALVAGNRVLVKNQTTASQNGIYLVAAGAWTRALDADVWAELPGAFTFVERGTLYGSCGFVCSVADGGTLGTTSITFAQFSGAGTYTAGPGLALTGTQFSLAPAADATIKSNISGGTAPPADNPISAVLDKLFGTSQGSVVYRGASGWTAATPGTSGQFLKTSGAGADPSWAFIPGGGDMLAANNLSDVTNKAAARGNLAALGVIRVKKFSASATYTPDPNLLFAVIEARGSGGGGGAAMNTGATGITAGAGGGSGGFSRSVVSAAAFGASKSVTVGAAGVGGAAGPNNGTAGGDVSVGALCIAKGGGGGTYSQIGLIGLAGPGGVPGTGDFVEAGFPGGVGFVTQITTVSANGGVGGGPGGGAAVSSGTGNSATNYGAGGSGGASVVSASNFAGGNGSPGIVIITEYCSQ